MAGGNKASNAWVNGTLPISTQAHLGWQDGNGNNIIDIFDVPLELNGSVGKHVTSGGLPTNMAYRFEAHTQPGLLASSNYDVPSSSLNFVDAIQVQVEINGSTHTGNLNLAGKATLLPKSADHWFTAETRVRDYEWDASFDLDLDALGVSASDEVLLKFRSASWAEYRDGDMTFDYTTDPTVTSNVETQRAFGDVNIVHSGTQTTEEGGSVTLDLVLNYPTTAPVTVYFNSNTITEGTPSQSSIVFQSTGWDIPKQITIDGVEDYVQDGDISYDINFTVSSPDMNYSGITLPSLTLTNRDNDLSEFTTIPYFIPVDGSATDWENPIILSEDGGSATVDVVMTADPNVTSSNPVTMTFYTTGWASFPPDNSEVTIDVGTLSFDSSNWNIPQTITITPIDDSDYDGEQKVKVWGVGNQSPYPKVDIPLIVRDNEYARVTDVEVNNQAGNGLSWIDASTGGVRFIDVTFDEAVTFTSNDVTIEKYAEGDLTSTPTIISPISVTGTGTTEMRIALTGSQTTNSWLKVTLDGTAIKDVSNYSLDGDAPGALIGSGRDYLYNGDDLVSGDGIAGGDAIFFVGNKIGDLDGDGDVDTSDVTTAFSNFTGPHPDPPAAPFTKTLAEGDLDENGAITIGEILTMYAEFTEDATSTARALDTLPINHGSPLLAETGPTGAAALGSALGDVVPQQVVDSAIGYWDNQGITQAQRDHLRNVRVKVADFKDSKLGYATHHFVYIDRDAAGQGWSAGDGGYDLLSTVTHEFGHTLGYADIYSGNTDNVMYGYLGTGMQRVASTATSAAASESLTPTTSVGSSVSYYADPSLPQSTTSQSLPIQRFSYSEASRYDSFATRSIHRWNEPALLNDRDEEWTELADGFLTDLELLDRDGDLLLEETDLEEVAAERDDYASDEESSDADFATWTGDNEASEAVEAVAEAAADQAQTDADA